MKNLEPKHSALLDEARERGQHDTSGIRLCFELLSLAGAIDRDCAARLAPHRLSEGKFVLLFLLRGHADGLSPHELATRAGVTRATITGLLDGLERDGFLVREGGMTDRRRIMVRLTAQGTATADAMFREHTNWITTLFSDLNKAEREGLSALLGRIWAKTDSGRRAASEPGMAS